MRPVINLLRRLEKAGARTEDTLLILLLLGMIGLAAWQILGRNLFNASFILGDELLRILVLWLTLAGAVAASRADRHISISLIDRFLPVRLVGVAHVITHGFTAIVCGLIAWHSFAFVRMSHEFGDTLLGDFPAWLVQIILPLGFGLMTWRHSVHGLTALWSLFKPVAD